MLREQAHGVSGKSIFWKHDSREDGAMDSSNYGSYHFEHEGTSRRRGKDNANYPDNDGIYAELQKLKSIVAEVESTPISGRASIDGTLMSTVFGVVLVMILSVSVYAFMNLYNALVKRFST